MGKLVDHDEPARVLYRATVLAVDTVGGMLENPSAQGTVKTVVNGTDVSFNATAGPANPPNSVKARLLTEGGDQFSDDESLRTFWPIMQSDHISLPIKPGEHVYVMFEDPSLLHGVWLSRVPGHVGANIVRGEVMYNQSIGSPLDAFPDTKSDAGSTTDKSAGQSVLSGKKAVDLFSDG